jgi:hypothetical protein
MGKAIDSRSEEFLILEHMVRNVDPSHPNCELLDKALEDVLAGSVFRSSRQCQALPRYNISALTTSDRDCTGTFDMLAPAGVIGMIDDPPQALA